MRKVLFVLTFALFITVWLFGAPQPAYAGGTQCPPESGASGYVNVDERNADITILPNGDVRYVETWVVDFIGTNFRFAFRTIPLNKLTDITDWSVSEGGTVYSRASSGEYVYQLSRSANERTIHWCFPPTSNQVRTFTLSYTVKGSLAVYDQQDQYFWKFIEADRGYTISRSTVRIHLPSPVSENQLELAGFVNGEENLRKISPNNVDPFGQSTVRILDSQTIEFSGGPFFGGYEWEIGVGFPKGLVSAERQSWQWFADNRPFFNLVALIGSFLLSITGILGLYMFWYFRGRDKPIGVRAEFYPKPPANIPPGVVGVLLDEMADMQDIMGTLIDLARRGFLRITEEKKSRLGSKSEFTFTRTDQDDANLLPYEEALLSAVFGRSKTKKLSSLKDKFYSSIPDIRKKMYEEVTKYGFFNGNPESVRGRYGCYGFAALVGVGVLAVGLYNLLFTIGNVISEGFALCLSASVLVFPIGLMVIARIMPRKTETGARAAMQWEAFKNYLKNIEKYQDVAKAQDQFEKYLPYAIAFGLEKSWVKKFERTNAPVPMWYDPFPVGRPSSTGGSGKVRGSPASQGSGAPSLDKAAGNVFGGLQSMSTGLFTMLDQASSTFTSAPSSSGSGGGGFSGGGGGGGGSSGFG